MGKQRSYYYKKTDKVKQVKKREEAGKTFYVVEFEQGLSVPMPEMRYKQAFEPKKGDSYTIILSNRGSILLKNYPKGVKYKGPDLRLTPRRKYPGLKKGITV